MMVINFLNGLKRYCMFKTFLDSVKAGMELQSEMLFQERTFMGYGVYVSDNALLAKGGIEKHIPGAMATYAHNIPVIIINTKMKEFPYLDAILAHEVGHHELGHMKEHLTSFKRFIPGYRNYQFEIEADNFSNQQGYNMLEALMALRDIMPHRGSRKELERRIVELSF